MAGADIVKENSDVLVYKRVTVDSVPCIELLGDASSSKDRSKRKKEKDMLGEGN